MNSRDAALGARGARGCGEGSIELEGLEKLGLARGARGAGGWA